MAGSTEQAAARPGYSSPEVLARIAPLGVRARQVVEGPLSGIHRSPFHGFSVEFAEYREYVPGDDLRRLDWRVYARSDRYFTKRYEEETNLRATLLVDCSKSMAFRSGAMSKFDYAATAAACLATVLVRQRDPIGLSLVDSKTAAHLPPSATQAQLARVIQTLEAAAPDGTTELGTVLAGAAETLHRRGLVVLLSDLLTDLDPLWEGLQQVKFRGHEVLVLHVLDRAELTLPQNDMILFKDMEGSEELFAEPYAFRKAYQQAMRDFQADCRDQCNRRGADYESLTTDEDLGAVLSRFLHARNRR